VRRWWFDRALAHRSGLRLTGVGVGALVLVLTSGLGATAVWKVTLAVAAYLVALEVALRWACRWAGSPRGAPRSG